MNKVLLIAAFGAALFTACGSDSDATDDDDKSAITADFLADYGEHQVDESCVRTAVDALSDDDAALLAGDLDGDELPEGLSAGADAGIVAILDCVDFDQVVADDEG